MSYWTRERINSIRREASEAKNREMGDYFAAQLYIALDEIDRLQAELKAATERAEKVEDEPRTLAGQIERLQSLLHFGHSFLEEAKTIIPESAEMQAWHDLVAEWLAEAAEAAEGEIKP